MPCLGPALHGVSQGSAWPLRWVEGQCGGQLRAVPPLLSLSGARACGMLHGAGTWSCMWVTKLGQHALQLSVPAVFGHMQISRTGADSLCFMPGMCFVQRHDLSSSVPVSARALCQADSPRGGLLWGPCRCKGLTAHAMASSATASSSGASQKTDWSSITWQKGPSTV